MEIRKSNGGNIEVRLRCSMDPGWYAISTNSSRALLFICNLAGVASLVGCLNSNQRVACSIAANIRTDNVRVADGIAGILSVCAADIVAKSRRAAWLSSALLDSWIRSVLHCRTCVFFVLQRTSIIRHF